MSHFLLVLNNCHHLGIVKTTNSPHSIYTIHIIHNTSSSVTGAMMERAL